MSNMVFFHMFLRVGWMFLVSIFTLHSIQYRGEWMPRVLEFTETITFFTGQYEKSLAVIFLCLYVCYPGEEQHMFHRRATTLD